MALAERSSEIEKQSIENVKIVYKAILEHAEKRIKNDIQQLKIYREKQAQSLANKIQNGLIIVVFSGVVLLALIINFLVNQLILRRVNKLRKATQRVVKGDLTQPIERDVVSNIEKKHLTKHGRKIPVLFSGSVMHNDEGKVLGIICLAQNITERKQAEEAIKFSNTFNETILNTMESVCRLAGGMAHDFNNILTSITGFAELAIPELPDDQPVKEHLVCILRVARRPRRSLANFWPSAVIRF